MPNNLFPYPGNKARHSEWIVQHIPEHTCYVEPFGGAAGVLFNKPKSKVEVYNDLDGDIVHFFEVLRDRGDELQEWLECVPFSRQLHEEWATAFYDGERPDDDIERAGRFFYLRYSQYGGKTHGTSGFRTSWMRDFSGQYIKKTEALDDFSKRLRSVVIESDPYESIIRQYDSEDTVFYIDPPYDDSEWDYSVGSVDHQKLHAILSDIDGKCLISHDTIPHYYGDGFVASSVNSNFVMDGSGGRKNATEYLIMNFDADGEPLMSDAGQQGLEAFTDGGESDNSK